MGTSTTAVSGSVAGAGGSAGRAPRGRWSFRVARLFGIDIRVHATLVVLIVLIAGAHVRFGLEATIEGVGLVVAVFSVILLHELGHALTARRFGIGTRDILLLPIGGLSRLDRLPEKPAQELAVALAGPAVNVVIAGACLLLIALRGEPIEFPVGDVVGGAFLPKFALVNVTLAAFNLLPAFPMDGGRVIRALLAMWMDRARATEVAARIGQAMAVLFAVAGLFGSPILILIAAFVWIAAGQEARAVQLKSALAGVTVGSAMITDFRTLAPGDPVSHAADLVIAGSQQSFPVIEGGAVVGIVGVPDVVKALAEGGRETRVGQAMRTRVATAGPDEDLEAVLRRMEESEAVATVIVRGGAIVGMITTENIREFVMLKGAVDWNRGHPGGGSRGVTDR